MTNKHHNNFWTSILTPLMDRRGNSTDANNNLTTLSDGKGNLRTADSVAGKQDLQMTYSYAADKQITAETIAEDVLADTSFTASYDAGNRITNWNRAGAPVNNAQSWNYDDNGNWISTTKDGVTEACNHDNTDVDYRYDALGRRVIRQEGTTKTALIWWGNSEKHRRLVGVLDRMSGASEARRVKAREASLNQCAQHKHQAGQIHFIPFSLRQVVGSPPSLQIMKRQSRYSVVIQNDIMAHPNRLNSVIARAVDGSKFKLEWYHKNYLDHVYAVSDDDGDILEHYRYSAFGQVTIYNENGQVQNTTQIDNHILWNTRRRDELTGYYMYKFRHYSAELGRWLARDPIEEKGGVNLYGFVRNMPTWYWDYLGLEKKKCAAVITIGHWTQYSQKNGIDDEYRKDKKAKEDKNKKNDPLPTCYIGCGMNQLNDDAVKGGWGIPAAPRNETLPKGAKWPEYDPEGGGGSKQAPHGPSWSPDGTGIKDDSDYQPEDNQNRDIILGIHAVMKALCCEDCPNITITFECTASFKGDPPKNKLCGKSITYICPK